MSRRRWSSRARRTLHGARQAQAFHRITDAGGRPKSSIVDLDADVHPTARSVPRRDQARLEWAHTLARDRRRDRRRRSGEEHAYLGLCVVTRCSVGDFCQLGRTALSAPTASATPRTMRSSTSASQVGTAHLERGVDLSAHCVVDRGAISDTRVEAGTKMVTTTSSVTTCRSARTACWSVGSRSRARAASVTESRSQVTWASQVTCTSVTASPSQPNPPWRAPSRWSDSRGFPARDYKTVSYENRLVTKLPDLFARVLDSKPS